MSEKRGVLEGVKILDLTQVLSGPLGTCWLGDMGATIIKIENPMGGDYTRIAGPFVDGVSTYYATVNRNKRCITLNLKHPKGREIFLDLVKQSDVVTENFKPGVIDRLGIGFDVLCSVKPDIVLASISGYGQNGPYANRPGYDVVSQAMGGIMAYTGFPDDPPTKCGPSIGDVSAGMNLALGILAALYRAKKTGKPERVDVSLVDSVLALTTQDYIDYGHTKKLPKRLGNNYSLWCPYGIYKAMDKYFAIGIGNSQQWRAFCQNVIQHPEFADDPRYKDSYDRVEYRSEIDKMVNEWCSVITAKNAVNQLNSNNIPGALVYDYADIEKDENFTFHREMIRQMTHPLIGKINYINCPIRFANAGLVDPKPAGSLGEFNEEVYKEYLGLDTDTLAQLKSEGVI